MPAGADYSQIYLTGDLPGLQGSVVYATKLGTADLPALIQSPHGGPDNRAPPSLSPFPPFSLSPFPPFSRP